MEEVVNDVVVVDTNVLLNHPDILNDYTDVVIPITVIEELDRFKSEPGERGFLARNAIRFIDKCEHVSFDFINQLHSDLSIQGWDRNSDNLIISSAIRHNAALLTGDLNMSLKAEASDTKVIFDGNNERETYTGIREITVTDSADDQQLLAAIYEYKDENVLGMFTNEYLIIKDVIGNTKDILRYNGSAFVPINLPGGKRGKGSPVSPKNDRQRCAIDLLNNKDIPIKFVCGTYGSGKTLLSIRMGLYHVKTSGQHAKLMVVRNPIGSGEEIGFLPGTKEEKIADFFKPISQNLDHGEIELRDMISRGELDFEVPYYMKGQSITDTYVLVDEAEDLDLKTLRLVGTRIGEGASVVFSGDWKQAEKQFQKDNGLMQAIEKLKGNPLVGVVVLNEDVRSNASKVFAELT